MKHKSGVTNSVVDAFSRWSSLLITIRVEVPGFDSFRDLLNTNLYFSTIMTVVQAGEQFDFLLHDGFLFKGNQLCILYYSLPL